MSLQCLHSSGSTNIHTAGSNGANVSAVDIYNANASETTFTCQFTDSSAGRTVTLGTVTIAGNSTGSVPGSPLNNGDSINITNDGAAGTTHHYTYYLVLSTNLAVDTFTLTDASYYTAFSDACSNNKLKVVNNRDSEDTVTIQYHDGSTTCIGAVASVFSGGSINLGIFTLVADQWVKIKATSGADIVVIKYSLA